MNSTEDTSLTQFSKQDFLVDKHLRLNKSPTNLTVVEKKRSIEKHLRKTRRKLGDLQNTLYAHAKYSVLVCFQGMDTSGKDSLIREVFKDFNVRGVTSYSFKKPSEDELKRDFLWRHYCVLPERGKYAVFNRSHYENVLISRIHPQIVLNENIPSISDVEAIPDDFWDKRLQQINNFEAHIADHGCIVIKFFLHISKDEQKNRLLRRLKDPKKNWKFEPSDISERKLWSQYQEVYQEVMVNSSFAHAPWYCIPSDNKPLARYLVAKIILETMEKYTDIQNPTMSKEVKNNLSHYKKILQSGNE
jgi:PPK2 family polyphosphate:nucleotide phosphotransferase